MKNKIYYKVVFKGLNENGINKINTYIKNNSIIELDYKKLDLFKRFQNSKLYKNSDFIKKGNNNWFDNIEFFLIDLNNKKQYHFIQLYLSDIEYELYEYQSILINKLF